MLYSGRQIISHILPPGTVGKHALNCTQTALPVCGNGQNCTTAGKPTGKLGVQLGKPVGKLHSLHIVFFQLSVTSPARSDYPIQLFHVLKGKRWSFR